jgi:hypothetical protein
LAIGAAGGAPIARFTGVGIDDHFIHDVAAEDQGRAARALPAGPRRVVRAVLPAVDAIKQHRWREVDSPSARVRALSTVGEKLGANPARMTASDWQPLRDLGFDDESLLEVGHIVGIFNNLIRLADGFGLQLDSQVEEAGRTGVALGRRERHDFARGRE